MPTSKETVPLTAEYIEVLHDEGISVTWPGIEPVGAGDCIDRNLLRSAAEQPFQGGFGVEYFYPTIYDKAACLFFSIAGGHIFGNGNKRTAILALDQFLAANSIYLLLPNEAMYALAIRTATYRLNGENPQRLKDIISATIRENSIEFRQLRTREPRMYRRLHRLRRLIHQAIQEDK